MKASRRVCLRVAGFVAMFLSTVSGCADEGPVGSEYELSGYVREAFTGAVVEGATVTFTSDTLSRASTSTDDEGFYEMIVLSDTPFGTVRAEKAGFLPGETTVYFDTQSRHVDVELRPAPPAM